MKVSVKNDGMPDFAYIAKVQVAYDVYLQRFLSLDRICRLVDNLNKCMHPFDTEPGDYAVSPDIFFKDVAEIACCASIDRGRIQSFAQARGVSDSVCESAFRDVDERRQKLYNDAVSSGSFVPGLDNVYHEFDFTFDVTNRLLLMEQCNLVYNMLSEHREAVKGKGMDSYRNAGRYFASLGYTPDSRAVALVVEANTGGKPVFSMDATPGSRAVTSGVLSFREAMRKEMLVKMNKSVSAKGKSL